MRKGLKNELNPSWKGDGVGYKCLHKWVRRHKGKPEECIVCNESDKRLVWANKSGEYKRDLNDWIAMCYSCHFKYDDRPYWGQHHRVAEPWNRGKSWSDEVKEKIRQKALGRKHSEVAKQKMKGRIPWNKGLKIKILNYV